ncbi:hypothetical protein ATG66_2332 [Vibrio sp. ES.051]|uniref:J domain-containing protein n=1 Tax=Vibrio sp. ES.051 TaxID=1761909 RepID=UPI000BF495AA|nr:J domain-containing protein [Vibrio sp. ES.051]PFG56009.1 hypothetical protein ATG66_2332 [Vibrio sp. ES.051]
MPFRITALICLLSLCFSGYIFASQSPTDPAEQFEYAQQLAASTNSVPSDIRYWLEQSASQNYIPAQKQLARDFSQALNGPIDDTRALYWLASIALNDPTDRGFLLAEFVRHNKDRVTTSQLVEAWYQLAAVQNPKAEEAYNQYLEQRFNQLRAKQVSEIEALDRKAEFLPQGKRTVTTRSDQNSSVSQWLIWFGAIVFIATVSLVGFKTHQQHRKTRETQKANLTQQLNSKVNELEFTNKQLKRQLEKVFKEFRKIQTHTDNHKLAMACAMFGYTPQTIPGISAIKLRYRQLSKLYHPDARGSEEEMKRLNQAFKLISQNVT